MSLPTKRQLIQNAIQSFFVYTKRVTVVSFNSVANAIINMAVDLSYELWHRVDDDEKTLYLSTANDDATIVLGAEKGVMRDGATNASCIVVILPVYSIITKVTVDVVPGSTDYLLKDGSKFSTGDTIFLRKSNSENMIDPPIFEETEVDDKPDVNTIRVITPAATFIKGGFALEKVTVPKNTALVTDDGQVFTTTQAIVTGENNINLIGASKEIGVLDKTFAVSTDKGIQTNVGSGAINRLQTPINGISKVFNPLPATGGQVIEPISMMKSRIQVNPEIFATDTNNYYLNVIKTINKDIARVYSERSPSFRTTKLTLTTLSGATLTTDELTRIETALALVSRANLLFDCVNITYTSVEIFAVVKLLNNATLQDVFTAYYQKLIAFLDWRSWPYGEDIDQVDLSSILNSIDNVGDVDAFSPAVDITVADTSLPKLVMLSLQDADNSSNILNGDAQVSFLT